MSRDASRLAIKRIGPPHRPLDDYSIEISMDSQRGTGVTLTDSDEMNNSKE
jgi:hypothetical protein